MLVMGMYMWILVKLFGIVETNLEKFYSEKMSLLYVVLRGTVIS